MRKWSLALVATIVLGLFGCGKDSRDGASAARTDWYQGAPPLCLASDLRLGASWQAAAGHFGGRWSFENTTRRTCVVEKGMRARVIDPRGEVVARGEPNRETIGPASVTLDPKETAGATVLWSNWCGERSERFHVAVVLTRGRGSLLAAAPATATCTGPPSVRSTISVSDFGKGQ